MKTNDYYETLGVPRNADAEHIKKAYREKAFKYHPDRNPGDQHAEEEFKKISEAYTVLGDSEKRRMYDMNPNGYAPRQDAGFDTFAGYGTSRGFEESPFGNYTWSWSGPFGTSGQPAFTRKDALEMLLKNAMTALIGVFLFRVSLFFGILGLIICTTMIARGVINSLRAIKMLFTLKE